MAALPHLPALRRGRPYASLNQVTVNDCRTGEPLARLSQVNAGIIRKDLAERAPASLPTFLKYKTHMAEPSLYNTPNTWGIYLIKLVTEWVDSVTSLMRFL